MVPTSAEIKKGIISSRIRNMIRQVRDPNKFSVSITDGGPGKLSAGCSTEGLTGDVAAGDLFRRYPPFWNIPESP